VIVVNVPAVSFGFWSPADSAPALFCKHLLETFNRPMKNFRQTIRKLFLGILLPEIFLPLIEAVAAL